MIHFEPLQEKHFPLLLKWLETPHVKAWWDQDVHWTMDLIHEKYGKYVKGFKRLKLDDQVIEKPIHAFIMCIDGQEVGYIQSYNAYDFPREQGYEIKDMPESLASIDVFMGEKEWVGKGQGPRLMGAFIKEFVFPYFNTVFVDPETANTHAIRAYEKAGFKKIKTTNQGTITWMVREK
jgi:aminoglycoside 6'-N-acetyltransferase